MSEKEKKEIKEAKDKDNVELDAKDEEKIKKDEEKIEDERLFIITIDDKEVEFYIRDPSLRDSEAAEAAYTDKYNQVLASGGKFRGALDKEMKKQGLWSDADEAKYTAFEKELETKTTAVLKGGIKLELARKHALRIREIRAEMREMKQEMASQASTTIEGQAANTRFNHLLVSCLVYNNDRNKRYFSSVDAYLESTNDPVAALGAIKFATVNYGLGVGEEDLPENQFLKQFKFIDDSLRLINDKGKLVDMEGRYIDDIGRYIEYAKDDKGKESTIFIDIDGREVDKDGKYKFDKIKYL